MKQQNNLRISLIAAACAALTLAACGGGGSSTGSTSTTLGTAVVSGTVTGFGSVIVDGVRIDDQTVTAGVENADGSVTSAELKIGQHVEVEHDGNLVAKSIRIMSEVAGAVSAVDTTAGTLTVLGQTATVNTDPAAGPVTVFEAPYQGLADIKVNDLVEVHALIKTDTAGKTTLQATRIEKKLSADASRLRGTVAALSTTDKTFKIGDLLISYANANVTPTPATLANGSEVAVWIPLNATTSTADAVNATKVKIRDRKAEAHEMEAKLGGVASQPDTTAKTFMIDSVKVDASEATFEQRGKTFADIKDGTYVRVKGTYLADGTLKATTIVLRMAEEQSSGGETELHGTILNFTSNADFTVRDVHVDASSATISCGGSTTLSNNLQVEVEGSLTAEGKVIATQVKCENTKEGQSVVERKGIASNIDLTAKTLVLGSGAQSVTVQWSDNTLFVNVALASLDGKTIKVEGTLSGGVINATKIKLD